MIIIIDFGAQYNQLIARRVRENNVFCQIEAPATALDAIRRDSPQGINTFFPVLSEYQAENRLLLLQTSQTRSRNFPTFQTNLRKNRGNHGLQS